MIGSKDVVGDQACIQAQEHEITVGSFGKLEATIEQERTRQPRSCDQQASFGKMERPGEGRVSPFGGRVKGQPKGIGEALGRALDGVTGAGKHRSACWHRVTIMFGHKFEKLSISDQAQIWSWRLLMGQASSLWTIKT